MIEGITHIGIIVVNIEEVVESLCRVYQLPKPSITYVESRKMKVTVLPFGGAALELVEDFNEGSELTKKVLKEGPFIHHFALNSTNVVEDAESLGNIGCELDGAGPIIGLRGKMVQFYKDAALGLLIELTES